MDSEHAEWNGRLWEDAVRATDDRRSSATVSHPRANDRHNDRHNDRANDGGGVQAEIAQRRPFHSVKAEVSVSILRTAALIERHFAQVVSRTGITTQQYNVLRILRGAGPEGLPTLVIRDRMIHEAPGITRLLDKLEASGLARRERASPDRRQVFCYITDKGLAVLNELDEEMRQADEVAAGDLSEDEMRTLVRLLERVRSGRRRTEP